MRLALRIDAVSQYVHFQCLDPIQRFASWRSPCTYFLSNGTAHKLTASFVYIFVIGSKVVFSFSPAYKNHKTSVSREETLVSSKRLIINAD
jgi:hypothetical protein